MIILSVFASISQLKMRVSLVFWLVTAIVTASAAQPAGAEEPSEPPAEPAPAPPPAPSNRTRLWIATGSLTAGYAGFATWAYFAWYHNRPDLPGFSFGGDGYFGENTYAGGADKVGHFFAPYAITRGSTELLVWGGWPRRRAGLVGGGLCLAFWTLVEVKDAYYYQMSPGDLIADALGVAAALAMDEWPRLDELVDFRVAYWPSPRYRTALIEDGDVNVAEDYSGHTYLLALHLGALPGVQGTRSAPWLDVIDFTVGFDATGYKPDPRMGEPESRNQRLFVGFSLNLQGVVDRTLDGTPRAAGHGTFEVVQLPFTTLPVLEAERSPDR